MATPSPHRSALSRLLICAEGGCDGAGRLASYNRSAMDYLQPPGPAIQIHPPLPFLFLFGSTNEEQGSLVVVVGGLYFSIGALGSRRLLE